MKKTFAILFCSLVSVLTFSQIHFFELWTGLETSTDLTKRFSLDWEIESRYRHSYLLKQISSEIGAEYRITKPLYVSITYKYASKQKTNGFFPEHTFATVFAYKRKINNFRVAVQTKLNVSHDTYTKNEKDLLPEIVDKNRIKVSYTSLKRIQPSLLIETYHPIAVGSNFRIATVKYNASCSFAFKKKLQIETGYMLRHKIDANELISILVLSLSKDF